MLCVGVALTLVAMTNAGAAPPTNCDTQVNDTQAKLLPCIQQKDLWAYMEKFQAIAESAARA